MLSQAEFDAYTQQGYNRIPVILALFADLDTPLSLYLKLANQPYSYLLESVVGGERFGRYSYIGLPASTRLRVNDRHVQVEHDDRVIEQYEGDPLAFIEAFQARFRAPPQPQLPRFTGGLVGYFGYETIRLIEKRLAHCRKPDPIGVPDILLMQSEELAVLDNLSGMLYLIVYADPAVPNSRAKAVTRLNTLRAQLRQTVELPLSFSSSETQATSLLGADGYKAMVEKAKRYITAGDIMQVVPSHVTCMPFNDSPLALYRALRSINPSPYMYLYHFDDFHVVGASPEILVRKEQHTVTVRPIAGTRPRGQTRELDQALEAELLADPKEIAEHVMLMDLGRNDVGRIAETGSVKVTEPMSIERYSHVMHIVSNVEGTLKSGYSCIDVIKATFPAGTVSGAPKVRAMEIIDELEPVRRSIYAGAVGYLGYNGDMDLAIAIRTAVLKEGQLYVQAGGGIVADSEPEAEWQETQNKARAVVRAAQRVQAGLDE